MDAPPRTARAWHQALVSNLADSPLSSGYQGCALFKCLILLVFVSLVAGCSSGPQVIAMPPKESTQDHKTVMTSKAQMERKAHEERKVLAVLGTTGPGEGAVMDTLSGSSSELHKVFESQAGIVAVPPKPSRGGRATLVSTQVVNTSKVDARKVGVEFSKLKTQVRYCYQRQLRHDSKLAGTVNVRCSINAQGKVESVKVLDNNVHPTVGTCVQSVLKRLRVRTAIVTGLKPALLGGTAWRFQP